MIDEIIYDEEDCENYLDGFCLMHIGDARVWDCKVGKKERLKVSNKKTPQMFSECPYISTKERYQEMKND